MTKNILIGIIALIAGLAAGYFFGPKVVPYEYQEVQEYLSYQSKIDSLNHQIVKMNELWNDMKEPTVQYETKVKYIRELRPIKDSDSLLNSVNNFLRNE